MRTWALAAGVFLGALVRIAIELEATWIAAPQSPTAFANAFSA